MSFILDYFLKNMFSQENHLKLNNVLESFYTNSEYKCNFDFLKNSR